MRAHFLFAFALLITPVLGEDWSRYGNERFGFSIAVPPGFEAQGEAGNGDGQSFALANRPARLSAWGGYLMDNFGAEVADAKSYDAAAGWSVTYEAEAPGWATWSASNGGRILYQRVILLCDGASYAAFRLEYSQADRPDMDPLVDRLAASLQGAAC